MMMSIGGCNVTQTPGKLGLLNLQEQMVEKIRWKKIRGIGDQEQCRLCSKFKETVQHLLAGCKKLAVLGYIKHNDNALKAIAIQWAVEKGILPEGIKCSTEQSQEGG